MNFLSWKGVVRNANRGIRTESDCDITITTCISMNPRTVQNQQRTRNDANVHVSRLLISRSDVPSWVQKFNFMLCYNSTDGEIKVTANLCGTHAQTSKEQNSLLLQLLTCWFKINRAQLQDRRMKSRGKRRSEKEE